MFVQSLRDAPVNERGDGQVSYLTLAPGQHGCSNLAITWVECAPGSQQPLHAHPDSEQVYVIVRGEGTMIVDEEERMVGPGDTIFIPPGSRHAIRNESEGELVFASAAAPPFAIPSGEFAYHPPAGDEA
jgi:mannose-6-phosphate isomerase-like protein (cupin superfamily)